MDPKIRSSTAVSNFSQDLVVACDSCNSACDEGGTISKSFNYKNSSIKSCSWSSRHL